MCSSIEMFGRFNDGEGVSNGSENPEKNITNKMWKIYHEVKGVINSKIINFNKKQCL